MCINEILFLYFCVVNETKTLCLLIAVSLQFKKQNARRKNNSWVFSAPCNGFSKNASVAMIIICIPVYACVHLLKFVCFYVCFVMHIHRSFPYLLTLVYVHLTETKTKVKETNIDFPKKFIENQCSLILFSHLFSWED